MPRCKPLHRRGRLVRNPLKGRHAAFALFCSLRYVLGLTLEISQNPLSNLSLVKSTSPSLQGKTTDFYPEQLPCFRLRRRLKPQNRQYSQKESQRSNVLLEGQPALHSALADVDEWSDFRILIVGQWLFGGRHVFSTEFEATPWTALRGWRSQYGSNDFCLYGAKYNNLFTPGHIEHAQRYLIVIWLFRDHDPRKSNGMLSSGHV